MSPITPHFDADSTNVYYKLHTQPTYGLRVGEGTTGHSDGTTYWTRENYDTDTGKSYNEYWDGTKWVKYINETDIKKIAGDIYFNKAAFEAQVGEENINKKVDEENIISILPTGKSGNKYYDHNSHIEKEAKDIQEIKISLPSIGNMMSDAWDIIHGPNRDDAQTDENGSLQGRLDSIKNLQRNQIPIKRFSDGTIIGTTINGDSRKTVEKNEILLEDLSTSFDGDDAWIRTEINTSDGYGSDCIAIHHTFHADNTNYDSTSNLNTDSEKNKIKLYTPKVDNAGHVVGKSINTVTLPYGYKTITTNGLSESTTIDLDSSTGRTSSADNTQDTLAINTVNKWIQTEVTNDKIEFAHEIHDIDTTANDSIDLNDENMGKLDSLDWTAEGFKQYRDMKTLGVDSNTLVIPDWSYDNAGHIINKKSRKYILPYSFKKIAVSGDNTGVKTPDSAVGTQIADNT